MHQKPNLVYILADDMGYGDVSYLNPQSAFRTPNLDRLGREGLCFTDAHATSAVCTPSRYGILTGMYNWRSPLKQGVLSGYSPALISPGTQTVASMLRHQGYDTACIGKWHLGMDWQTTDGQPIQQRSGSLAPGNVDYQASIGRSPNTFGFDYFYGISASLDMPPYVYIENDHVTQLPDHEDPGKANPPDGFAPDFHRPGPCAPDFRHEDVLPHLCEKAVEYITGQRGKPFFLYFPLPAPHTPIVPTAPYIGCSATNLYGDFCVMCDGVVGKVMDALQSSGQAENTILIFASDNGCSPQADFSQLAQWGHFPSYHFRGYKADIYEGGHRIPLLIRWPQMIAPGRSCDEVVCLCDLMATMAEILDVPLAPDMGVDSVSNLPVWRGEAYQTPLREATVHQSIDGSLSIRKGKYKLEMCPGSGGWSYPRPNRDDTSHLPSIQLYDLSEDLGEKHNLAEQLPEVVQQLKTLLVSYVRNGRSTPGPKQPNQGAEIWESVKWLEQI